MMMWGRHLVEGSKVKEWEQKKTDVLLERKIKKGNIRRTKKVANQIMTDNIGHKDWEAKLKNKIKRGQLEISRNKYGKQQMK